MKKSLAIIAALAAPSLVFAKAEPTADGVLFTFDAREMQPRPVGVTVAGSFNGWNSAATPMTDPENDGTWTALVPLGDGLHHYKFVVNGDQWLTDPTDDADLRVGDNYGGQNSGVIVGPDIRKAPPPEANAINLEFVRHDPLTDAVPIADGEVRVVLRTQAGDVEEVAVMAFAAGAQGASASRLDKVGSDGGYDVFAGPLSVIDSSADEADYGFQLTDGSETLLVFPDAAFPMSELPAEPPAMFTIAVPKFDIPEWAADAVWYQVFLERFRNGDTSNDPGRFAEYERMVPWNSDWWDVLPGETPADETSDNFYTGTGDVWMRRYGGDFQGLREKLPYLRELGVNAIYLNPVFEAESMHKYDTADFRHIDDNFAAGEGVAGGSYPYSVEGETDDPATWQWSPSDKLFLDFLQEAHGQGFRVIIDGVFNHTGRAHPFFQDVLEKGKDSKYADWFEITDWGDPENWRKMEDPYEVHGKPGGIRWVAWDGPDGHLPVFKKDAELGLAPGPRQHIFDITRRWLDPDGDPTTRDGIDGWRLDVPGDIPHPFWRDWRKVVKDANPDAYITGEIWQWAQPWLKGDQFDAVMNYQWAMAAQDFFVDRETAITPSAFADRLDRLLTEYPRPITFVQQNLFDSHDTDRLVSMVVNPDRPYDGANRPQDNAANFAGPAYSEREPNADEWRRAIQAVEVQHAFVGAPMTYYGNEAGMWSPDDPSNRQPLPWPDQGPYDAEGVGFNEDVFEAFQRAIGARNALPALRTGDYELIGTDDDRGLIGFRRTLEDQTVLVLVNRSGETAEVTLDVEPGSYVDYLNPDHVEYIMRSRRADARPEPVKSGEAHDAADGKLSVTLPAHGTLILNRE
jgi:glycosidase